VKRAKLPFYPVAALNAPGTRAALDAYARHLRAPKPPAAAQVRRGVDGLVRAVAKLGALDMEAVGQELHRRDLDVEQRQAVQGAIRSMQANADGLARRTGTQIRGQRTDLATAQLVIELAKEYKRASGKAPMVTRVQRGTRYVYVGDENGDFMAFAMAAVGTLPADVKRPSKESIGYYALRVVAHIDDPESLLRELLF